MRPPYLLILLLLPLLAFGQTKTVTKTISTNALTESFVVPSGASVTISPGASIINQGTATGFDTSITVPWANITSKPTTLSGFGITDGVTASAVAAGYQPLDGDLTSIAALATNSFGRGLLTLESAAAVRSAIGLGTLATQNGNISDYLTTAGASTSYQPLDADLTSIAALSTSIFGRSLLTQADASATRTTLGLGTLATQNGNLSDYLTSAGAATSYQPLDADLTSIAALTTDSFGRSLLTQTSASATRTLLGLGTLATQSGTISDYLTTASAATTYQPRDTDLLNIAALSTAEYGRNLLTLASARAARQATGVENVIAASPETTRLTVSGILANAYIAVPTSAATYNFYWWLVDGVGTPPPAYAGVTNVAVPVDSSQDIYAWAAALGSATGGTVSGNMVEIIHPVTPSGGVSVDSAGGTVSASVIVAGSLEDYKLYPIRGDDLKIIDQVNGAIPYFFDVWRALVPVGEGGLVKLSPGESPTIYPVRQGKHAALSSDFATTSSTLANVMSVSLDASTAYLVVATGPHTTSVTTEGTFLSLGADGSVSSVVFMSVNFIGINTLNGVSISTTLNGYSGGALTGPGPTVSRPFILIGYVVTSSSPVNLSLRAATETTGTSTLKAGSVLTAIPIH
jgi:hypothetical protein